ncbi:MAG: xylulokinase [Thermodesulfobacteriota bacterium]
MNPRTGHEEYVLAIDHGTSGVKSAVVSMHGKVMDFVSEKTPIRFLPGGGAEQDPDDWWGALIRTAGKLVANRMVAPENIRAMAVSSTFSTTVAVDAGGRHLMNALTWMDSRGAPHVRRIMQGFPRVAGYGLWNILRWLPKTGGGPTLSGKDDIAHVLLIKHEFPEIYARTRQFLPSKDYLNLKLTGQFAASHDSIQLFWVTDIRDIHHIRYDDGLIRRLGIEKDKLPPLKRPTDVLGVLLPEVAREIGLQPDVKVIMGSPDHQCACVGSGAVRDFDGHLYIGTSSWVQAVVPFKKTDVFRSIASFPSAVPGKYQSVNEQDMAGKCLDFLLENVIFHGRDIRSRTRGPADIYAGLDEIVSAVPAGSHKLLFTPWLNGERTPVDDGALRGGLYNLSKTTTRDHIIRAVMEGVAYNTRWSLRYVERFIGRRMACLNIIGGGAQSDAWCQIFADVLNREIRQVDNPIQANARGAAFIASAALGRISFEDIPGLISFRRIYRPNPANRLIYDTLFGEFVNLYRRNKRMFQRLNNT